jgi:hypothetical protein
MKTSPLWFLPFMKKSMSFREKVYGVSCIGIQKPQKCVVLLNYQNLIEKDTKGGRCNGNDNGIRLERPILRCFTDLKRNRSTNFEHLTPTIKKS